MTKRWIGLAMAASLFAATGCKKDDKKPEGGGTTTPAGDKVTPEATNPTAGGAGGAGAAQVAAAMPQGAARLLAALPVDSEIVFGMDTGRLKTSALLAPLFDAAMKANTSKMGFDMQAECGIDPMKAMGKVVIGVRMIDGGKADLAIAAEGFERSAMLACVEKAKPKIEAQGFKVAVDGNIVSVQGNADGKPVYVAMTVTDDNVTIVRGGSEPVDGKALLAMATAKSGDGLTKSNEFMNMVGQTNTSATIWGLANGSSPSMQKLPLKFKAAFGSIDITDGVDANGRLRMASPDEATNVSKLIGGQLGSIKQMGFADLADATVDGSDVILKFTMKKQQLENIARLAGGALQQLGGGMGGMGGSGGAGAPPTGP